MLALKKCYLKVNTEKSLSSRQKKEKCLIEPGTKPDVGGRLETTKKFKFWSQNIAYFLKDHFYKKKLQFLIFENCIKKHKIHILHCIENCVYIENRIKKAKYLKNLKIFDCSQHDKDI